jgi:hypothetical protein
MTTRALNRPITPVVRTYIDDLEPHRVVVSWESNEDEYDSRNVDHVLVTLKTSDNRYLEQNSYCETDRSEVIQSRKCSIPLDVIRHVPFALS